jgi:hypothetical protein
LNDHLVRFIPPMAKGTNEWHGAPPAPTIAQDGECCTLELPRAEGRGSFKIVCEICPAWALVNVSGGKGDPLEFRMPCGRIRMAHEREAAASA